MKRFDYYYFKKRPEAKKVFLSILDLLTANINNAELFERINAMSLDEIEKWPEKVNIKAYKNSEYTSQSFVIDYLYRIAGENELFDSEIDGLLEYLIEKSILHKASTYGLSSRGIKDQEYLVDVSFLKRLVNNNSLYSYLFGFGYIIEHYRKSVVKIEVTKNGDKSIGTGWVIDLKGKKKSIRVVVTNYHVIEKAAIKIFDLDNNKIPHYEDEFSEVNDVAFIRIDLSQTKPDFTLSLDIELLDEVITIGYPSIPTTKDAFQVVHKGEVNADVDDYWGNKLIVISARTSPGNSGSPVLNDSGLVIGMVTRELFEKEAFKEKGIVPYSACIPAKIIKDVLLASKMFKDCN